MENLISYGISSFLKDSIVYDPSTKESNKYSSLTMPARDLGDKILRN
jgi:hypothetical protein